MSIPIRNNRPEAAAFSLVEVVLALGVIAISLVAILGVFPVGLSSNRTSVSDTRAAELANAIFATIDAQSSTFSSVQCYGATLDLTSLSTATADTRTFYASYSSPNQPVISSDPALADRIYSIELKFDNDPTVTGSGVKLGPGKLNKIQMRVSGKSTAEGFVEIFYIARNRS
jgi:uncharacterized protein (TIGR02598 family)